LQEVLTNEAMGFGKGIKQIWKRMSGTLEMVCNLVFHLASWRL